MSKKHCLIGGQTRLVLKTSQGHNEIKLKFKSYFVNLASARCCIFFWLTVLQNLTQEFQTKTI